MAAETPPSVQDRTTSTSRDQLLSPLLRLPAEVRNEICKLVVLSTYIKPIQRLRYRSSVPTLPWTRVCKQLWTETRLLAFALCSFSFCDGKDYLKFVEKTSSEQRGVVTSLHLELCCVEGPDGLYIDWTTDYDQDENPDETAAELDDLRFKSKFPNLQKMEVKVLGCFNAKDRRFVKRWIVGLQSKNEGVVLKVDIVFYGDEEEGGTFFIDSSRLRRA